jgi:S-adenosylmethionine:tRNA ribosyltransferase-isomerase
MTRSSKPIKVGSRIEFSAGIIGDVVEELKDGLRGVVFSCAGDFMTALELVGHMPLPPYIRREDQLQDRERYQTVFANNPGAIAAPTAGLHFTEETFASLEKSGIQVCGVTLHVGPGTFLPVRVENLDNHQMHAELYEVPLSSAQAINKARSEGRRVVALGTTVTRTLEHAVGLDGLLQAGKGETDLFIKPGFKFRIVDALITNFHLPKSTLLVLVSAFAGRDITLEAYHEAIEKRYRFFSYGDCMLID